MKVLLVSHGSGPYGAERMLIALARGLTLRGHDVVVEFPHEGPATERARRVKGAQVRIGGRRRLPRSVWEAILYVLSVPATLLRLRRLVREVRPDVVWANSLYNPWAVVAAKLARAPVVWHLHERNPRRVAGLLPAWLIAFLADRAVGVSEYVAGSYRRTARAGRKTTAILNPLIQRVEPHPLRQDSPFTVGYVGQLESRKRVLDAVGAVAMLPGVEVLVLGDGKDRPRVQAAIEENAADPAVRLLGYRDDVYEQLRHVHCLSIPSLEEAFSLVAVEAMAAGVPVVAARSGALPEVMGDAALYHVPCDAADLAEQLSRLRDSLELRRELREKGLRRVERFGYDRWLDQVEALLRRLRPDQERT